jgi:hypothetical protein
MKDHHKIVALLGVGAVIVLILMLRRQGTASNGSLVADEAVQQPPSYPNAQPIQMGDIEVGGSPVNLTYNYGQPLPTLSIGDNTGGQCGCDESCEQAGQKVTVQNVNPTVLKNAQENFSGFISKTGGLRTAGGNPPQMSAEELGGSGKRAGTKVAA